MKYLIIGQSGFIGAHLFIYLKHKKNFDVIDARGLSLAASLDVLNNGDRVIYCSGNPRALNESNNVSKVEELICLLNKLVLKVDIAHISSVREGEDTPDGRSKQQIAKLFDAYAKKINSQFINLKFPNIYGPYQRPNFNSYAATLFHLMANQKLEKFDVADINLCFIYDACEIISRFENYDFIDNWVSTKSIVECSQALIHSYHNSQFPLLKNKIEENYFLVLRSYFPAKVPLSTFDDHRGRLRVGIKSRNLENQIFYSYTHPGVSRGNHFHFNKYERFMVVNGRAKIEFRNLINGELSKFLISSDDSFAVDIPPLTTHLIKNIDPTENLTTLFYSSQITEGSDMDTFPELVHE